ncbi:TMEM175 family protein [Rhodococcus gannanensis]|uniref:TMEM175 family protein n=1 Tax=Rhodococcus gannanensis TaxID=1960308 RepID=A0ABW4P1Z1_9NOCA
MDTQRGFERLVNFSDAVVAIAATLLVLPLVEIVAPERDLSVRELLAEHRSDLFAFVLGFLVIYQLWLLHHGLFRNLRGYDSALIWTNFVWLLSIVFLPFATKLLARGEGFERGTAALYIGTIAVAVAMITAARIVVVRHPELEFDDARGSTRVLPSAVATGIAFAALALSLLFPAVGIWFLVAFAFSGVITDLIRRVVSSRRGSERVP